MNHQLPGQRGFPVIVDGISGLAVFQEAEWLKLARMAETIRTKNAAYSDDDAIEWATRRAVEDGLFHDGVVRIGREHV